MPSTEPAVALPSTGTGAPAPVRPDPGAGAKPRADRRRLRRFGLLVGGAFVVLGAVFLWRGRGAWPYLAGPGGALMLLGLVAPRALAPVERAWMKLSLVLSVVMTHVILTLTFVFVITPVGLVRKLFVRDPLRLRADPARASYWSPLVGDRPAQRPDRPY